MLWQYLRQLLSFAFRRTTLAIDSLQIVAASAIPALARLVGVKMAPDIATETLAYIGAAGAAWIALRFLCAPYYLWRDQVGEIGALKLELSRPERLELSRRAELLARDRRKAARLLADIHLHFLTFSYEGKTAARKTVPRVGKKIGELIRIDATYKHSLMLGHILAKYVRMCADIEDSSTNAVDPKTFNRTFLLLLWIIENPNP